MKLLELFKKNALISSAIIVLTFITINTAIIYYNNWVLKETTKVKADTERALFLVDQIWNQVVRNVDIGMRGFALTKKESLLGPLNDGSRDRTPIFKELRAITARQGFPRPAAIDSIEMTVDQFVKTSLNMVQLAKIDSMNEFHTLLASDPGRDAWLSYDKNAKVVAAFENNLNSTGVAAYEQANTRTVIVQTLLVIFAIPTLIFVIFKILKDKKERRELFLKLERNNREFLFNPGTELDNIDEHEVIDSSIRNFKTATHFITQVSDGDFGVQWHELNSKNEALNKNNLAGELIQMRDKMKQIKAQDDIRNWTSEGLARFSDVIRQDQLDVEALSFEILVYLTKYLNGQQGGLFVVREDEEGHSFLSLTASYAFNRKKFVQKKIEIGEGMIGQVYLEAKPVMLTQIPAGYTTITSGLGEHTPTCLLIVPMIYNEKVEAVIEIAGFKKYEKFEVEFMEKVGEITASTLASAKNNGKMKQLVDQFKSQAEQLRAQEEELRQNMEEMEATQEAMRRER